MSGYRYGLAVEADIERVLLYTLRKFGHAKYVEYTSLIEEALHELDGDPRSGKPRPNIHPDAWVHHITQPGRDARHLFLYEVVDDHAYIYGFFHDAMDLPGRWRSRRT